MADAGNRQAVRIGRTEAGKIPAGTIRVFPRRTRATPDDPAAFVGGPPLFLTPADVQVVHVSAAFTWDRREAARLAREWSFRFPRASVDVGGPAYGDPGGEFIPGMYLRDGYVITSRGCPNHCRRCFVPGREGQIRLLPIRDGFNILDNNLLACPPDHVAAVCTMLRKQTLGKPTFTGGLEALRLTPDLAAELLSTNPKRLFFAYDRLGDYQPLRRAVSIIRHLTNWRDGSMRQHVSCYILVGFEGDTIAAAEERIGAVIEINVRAYPMYYRGEEFSRRPAEWADLIGGVIAMGGRRG